MIKKLTLLPVLVWGALGFSQSFRAGTELQQNRWYNSSEHNHTLIFQNDGNLVVYDDGDSNPIWSSNTQGEGARAVFQRDGNLVVYSVYGNPVYSSNTANQGGVVLKLQRDGNLVIYTSSGRAIWSIRGGNTNTGGENEGGYDDAIIGELVRGTRLSVNQKVYSSNRAYYLVFQRDGNLVFYRNGSNNALWASNTQGRGARVEFQDDGNLVVYDRYGNAIFSSNTEGRGNNLSVQNDGNVVIYDYNGNPLWSSNR